MSPLECVRDVMGPAFRYLPLSMDTPAARAMLVAIGLQESNLEFRRQHEDGPARGLWQFERGGGFFGVLKHSTVGPLAAKVVDELGYSDLSPAALFGKLETDDIFACCLARLLLYTVPNRLPNAQQPTEGWEQYMWAWRPGKPHPERWPDNYAAGWRAA